MSGECDNCSEHCLDCNCTLTDKLQPLSRRQENGLQPRVKELNPKMITLDDGIDPPAEQIPTKYINVNGRKEHEALLKDAEKCKELGLDQVYETIVYLNRWGSWLGE
jgi:hypothetical protein